MSRLVFFIREAFRALRRNGAPSMAAIVTTVVTVILLGVLIPIFQTTQAKSNQVRDSLEFRVAIYDDATQAEIDALQTQAGSDPPRRLGRRFISKTEALDELKSELDKKNKEHRSASSTTNPLPANFAVKADDASNLAAVRAAVDPAGPERQAEADLADRPGTPSNPSRPRRRSSR